MNLDENCSEVFQGVHTLSAPPQVNLGFFLVYLPWESQGSSNMIHEVRLDGLGSSVDKWFYLVYV